jgi:hypothetical protein
MARSVRIEFPGAYYHVMARSNRRPLQSASSINNPSAIARRAKEDQLSTHGRRSPGEGDINFIPVDQGDFLP